MFWILKMSNDHQRLFLYSGMFKFIFNFWEYEQTNNKMLIKYIQKEVDTSEGMWKNQVDKETAGCIWIIVSFNKC